MRGIRGAYSSRNAGEQVAVDALADLAQHPADRLVHEVLAVVEQPRRQPERGAGVARLDERERREHRHPALPQRSGCREPVEQRIVAAPGLAQDLARPATRPSCRPGPSCSRGRRAPPRGTRRAARAAPRRRACAVGSRPRTAAPSRAARRAGARARGSRGARRPRPAASARTASRSRASRARGRRRTRRPRRTGPGPVLKKRCRNAARRGRPAASIAAASAGRRSRPSVQGHRRPRVHSSPTRRRRDGEVRPAARSHRPGRRAGVESRATVEGRRRPARSADPAARVRVSPCRRQVVVDRVCAAPRGRRRRRRAGDRSSSHLDRSAALELAHRRGAERLLGRGRDRLARVQLASCVGAPAGRWPARRAASAARGGHRR